MRVSANQVQPIVESPDDVVNVDAGLPRVDRPNEVPHISAVDVYAPQPSNGRNDILIKPEEEVKTDKPTD